MNPSDSRISCDAAITSAEIARRKTALRTVLLAARNALPPGLRKAAVDMISEQLLHWIEQSGLTSVAVYSAMRGEPDLSATWHAMAQADIALALPIVIANDAPLGFAAWQPGQEMEHDRFGIDIPASPRQQVVPQAILVPCLGFTPERIRLGYGGGFYDRTLADLSGVIAVGIAFDCGKADFAAEAHDITLNAVITESGVI